jgi:hypothetical protein
VEVEDRHLDQHGAHDRRRYRTPGIQTKGPTALLAATGNSYGLCPSRAGLSRVSLSAQRLGRPSLYDTGLRRSFSIPDVDAAAEALGFCYSHPSSRALMRAAVRFGACSFTYKARRSLNIMRSE